MKASTSSNIAIALALFQVTMVAPAYADEFQNLISICGTGEVEKLEDLDREPPNLQSIVKKSISGIRVSYYDPKRWASEEEASKAIKDLFTRSLPVSESWRWNLAPPLTLRGDLEFANGDFRPFGVAQHRVCFLDPAGKAWYFEWREQVPWK